MFEAFSFWCGFFFALTLVGVCWLAWYLAPLELHRPPEGPHL
jgi:hypothetical protein